MIKYVAAVVLSQLCLGIAGARGLNSDATQPPPRDAYQIMRESCADAGDAVWVRCHRAIKLKDASARTLCNDNQEKARRMCMLEEGSPA